jgi:hypothetical protein
MEKVRKRWRRGGRGGREEGVGRGKNDIMGKLYARGERRRINLRVIMQGSRRIGVEEREIASEIVTITTIFSACRRHRREKSQRRTQLQGGEST